MKKLLIFSTLLLIFGGASWGVFDWLWPLYLKTYPLPIDIATFRLQFPLYNDVEGDTLATTLYDNFFSHISQERFRRHFIPPELDKPEYMQTKPPTNPPSYKGSLNLAFIHSIADVSDEIKWLIEDVSQDGRIRLLTAPPPPWIKDAGIVSLAGAGVGALFWLSYILIGMLGWFARLRLWRFLWVKRQGLVGLVCNWQNYKFWGSRKIKKIALLIIISAIIACCLFPPWLSIERVRGASNIKQFIPQGYGFLLSPPTNAEIIDTTRLVIQIGALLFLGSCIVFSKYIFPRKKPNPKSALPDEEDLKR